MMMVRVKFYSYLLCVLLGSLLSSAITTVEPEKVILTLDETLVSEGDVIKGEVILTLKGPVDVNTFVEGSIANTTSKRKLTEVLENAAIEYAIEEGDAVATTPEPTKTLVFPAAGKQIIHLKVPKNAVIKEFKVNIHGKSYQEMYPKIPSLDIGDDGTKEWKFLGGLEDFGSYITAAGLDASESGEANIENKEQYFCELIDLPSTKDVIVAAKYAYQNNNANKLGNITAVIFSFTQTGSTIKAQGGANRCDLPELTTNPFEPAYQECTIGFNSFISGKKLVCVVNSVSGSGSQAQYKLRHDAGQSTIDGYTCTALVGGEATCQKQDRDFLIKVKTGEYGENLIEQAAFEEGKTEYVIEQFLTNYAKSGACDGKTACIVPVAVATESKGIIYLDGLSIEYQSAGTTYVENNFYGITGTKGAIIDIDGNDLTNKTLNVSFALSDLAIVAPTVTGSQSQKNFTIKVDLQPGPSKEKVITVKKKFGSQINGSTAEAEGMAEAYKQILMELLGKEEILLEVMGKREGISQAIDDLEAIEQETGSTSEVIKTKIENIVKKQPRTIVGLKTISDQIVIAPDDITENMLLEDQKDEESKEAIYQLQSAAEIQGEARLYKITHFDNSELKGTFITKDITSSAIGLSRSYIVEVIPSSMAKAVGEIQFAVQPEILQQTNPIIVRWDREEIGDTFGYEINKDVLAGFKDSKTILIPEKLIETMPESLAQCGDNVCTVIDIGGEKIPLEDKYTCPQDCARKFPWTLIILAFVFIGIVIYYFNFYKGKWNYQEVVQWIQTKMNKKGTQPQTKAQRALFVSKNDENNVYDYIESATKRGFNKQKITEALLAKGWTREQIEYSFKNFKK